MAAPGRGSGAAARKDATLLLPRRLAGALRAPVPRRPSDSLLLAGAGEGGSRTAPPRPEAQRRDAGRAAARQPRAPRTSPRLWPGSPQQFRARGGAGNGSGGQQRPKGERGPGPRVTHRLKCSMIFSSRTFSGKLPTQRCLVSRTMLGGVPATAGAGSPSPASYEPVSAGRRAPRRRRRRLRRWRRQRRRLLRLPPVQRPSLSPRF